MTRLTTAYDLFARQAALALARVCPGSSKSVQRTSALVIADNGLKTEFVDFVGRLNYIDRQALWPYRRHLEQAYQKVFMWLERLGEALSSQRLQGNGVWATFGQLPVMFMSLKNEWDGEILAQALRMICRLFDHHVGPVELGPGKGKLTRSDMVTAASGVGVIVAAMEAFPEMVGEMKAASIKFNEELAAAHGKLKLKYTISMVVEREGEERQE
jgi:hypothetical protein